MSMILGIINLGVKRDFTAPNQHGHILRPIPFKIDNDSVEAGSVISSGKQIRQREQKW